MGKPKPANQSDLPLDATALKRLPGRPQRHTEPIAKICVILLDRHDMFLNRLSFSIREKTRARVSKSEILRAFTEAVAESEIDLSSSRSEAEVKEILLSRLRKRK